MVAKQQYQPDEAWIVFRLNSVPIRTRRDGDFDCFAFLDAATLLIHSMEMVPASSAGPTRAQAAALFVKACGAAGRFPTTLLVSARDAAVEVANEAQQRGIQVERVPARTLARCTREAREAFAAHFGGEPT